MQEIEDEGGTSGRQGTSLGQSSDEFNLPAQAVKSDDLEGRQAVSRDIGNKQIPAEQEQIVVGGVVPLLRNLAIALRQRWAATSSGKRWALKRTGR